MKKLYYSLLITLLVGALNAQVLYTDVAPDLTYTITDSTEIDINNNGSIDVRIYAKNLSYTSVLGYSILTNSIYATNGWTRTSFLSERDSSLSFGPYEWSSNPYYYPKATALNYGDTICGKPSWFLLAILAESGTINGSTPHNYGEFLGVSHKYLCGWTIDSTNSSYYYWIGLGVGTKANTFTLKDYGFEASGACLLAGEGSPTTSIKTNVMESVELNYNNEFIKLTINHDDYSNGSLSIYDLNGKVISNVNIINKITNLNTSNFTPGVYIASYKTATAGKSIKFLIQ